MFGALSLIAVRQQHYEAAHPKPLRLAGGNELIDDHLCAVGEITELRLPHDQRMRLRQRIAVLKPEDSKLGEGGYR